jgi:hypothetical protein
MRSAYALFAAVLPAIAACGTATTIAVTNPSPRPLVPRSPAEVDVFTSSAPSQPFVEVAIIQSRQESIYSFDQMPEIIAAMREEAARAGCDGVVLHGASDKVVPTGNKWGSTATLEGFWGACIVYTGAPVPAAYTAAAPSAAAPAEPTRAAASPPAAEPGDAVQQEYDTEVP